MREEKRMAKMIEMGMTGAEIEKGVEMVGETGKGGGVGQEIGEEIKREGEMIRVR